ncbi:MAG: hypothetical protein AAB368_03655, partial [bacterium]
ASFAGERLTQLLGGLFEADRIVSDFQKKGLPVADVLEYADMKIPPRYVVETAKGKKLIFSDAEYEKYLPVTAKEEEAAPETNGAAKGRKAAKAEQSANGAAKRNGEANTRRLHDIVMAMTDLANVPRLADHLKTLEKLGISRKELLRAAEAPAKKPARYVFKEGGRAYEASSLRDVIGVIRQAGQQGSAVQRFKGLAEMNASELWDTAMNPAARVLLQVTTEDSKRLLADHIFSILMGDQVEPRREFIQAYAAAVRNLDV